MIFSPWSVQKINLYSPFAPIRKIFDDFFETCKFHVFTPLAPSIYNIFIDGLIKCLREKKLGAHRLNQYAGVIILADDVALLSTSPTELQEMLNVTQEYTRTWRYRINPSKSRIVTFNEKKQRNNTPAYTWNLGDKIIPQANEHPHLGLTKSSTSYDPTDKMITKGTQTFYGLTGAGAYTGGLLPHHCARLWKVYCVPRMLYGIAVVKLTQAMRNKLDRAQHQLFKKVLGLPNSVADEAVFLLTGLVPLSMQVDLETLLLIGQLVNLPHSRYEVRSLLHAITKSIPLLRSWERILQQYNLPDLHTLIRKPIPYSTWKTSIKGIVNSSLYRNIHQSLQTKSSLALFKNNIHIAQDLYPHSCTSKFLRQAVIIRSQLVTQTYLTQSRLNTLKKTASRCCQMCKNADEDVVHFLAICPQFKSHRQILVNKLQKQDIPKKIRRTFQPSEDPSSFTQAVLFPCHLKVKPQHRQALLSVTLSFLYQIHCARASALYHTCST